MLQAAGSVPDTTGFFSRPNPSSSIMALGSTQPLTEMCTGSFPWFKGQLAHNADYLTATYESVYIKCGNLDVS
jgi:hypothetical protein